VAAVAQAAAEAQEPDLRAARMGDGTYGEDPHDGGSSQGGSLGSAGEQRAIAQRPLRGGPFPGGAPVDR
jgi:hypothetical protein